MQLFNYLYHMDPIGGVPLKGTGIAVGVMLLISHLYAWLCPKTVKAYLAQFPRDYFSGIVLLTVAFAWAMLCINYMDMGEFFFMRKWLLIIVPVSFVLVLIYVQEFLSVRALGSVLLLAAGPVLQAALLQPQPSRRRLPCLAYFWLIAGMFFVGTPYVLRDGIKWVLAKEGRWQLATLSGVVYGTLLITVALLWW